MIRAHSAFNTIINRVKEDEQMTAMKKISNEENYMVTCVCDMLLQKSDSFDSYIEKLCQVNQFLLQGYTLSEIIWYLYKNKYINCKGENNMETSWTTSNKGYDKYVTMSNKEIQTMLSEIIKDIDIIVPDKVVEVTFSDGLKEKMVCHKDDTFNLRNCLFIAIAKHLYKKDYTFEGIEWKAFELMHLKKYVKIVDSALKEFDKKQKKIEKLGADCKEILERIERRRAKRQAYKARRAAKREQAEKERQIEIQKEAYIQAMEYMKNMETM